MFDDYENNNKEDNIDERPHEEIDHQDTGTVSQFDVFSYLKRETPTYSSENIQSEPEQAVENVIEESQPEQSPVILAEPVLQAQPEPEQKPEPQPETQPAYQPTPVSPVQESYIPRPQVVEPVHEQAPIYTAPVNPYTPQEQYNPGASYLPRPQSVPQGAAYQPQKKKKGFSSFMKKNGLYIALGAVSLLLVLAIVGNIALLSVVMRGNKIGTGSSVASQTQQGGKELTIAESPKTDTTPVPGSSEELTFAQIAAKVRPSVVSVITYDPTSFGQNNGQGSGIIYDADGYIVTNAHVISNSKSVHVTVVFSDEREFDAKILGYDTRTDLAVLKIEASGLPAAEFGESDKLVAGDEVIAIGNPGGEQFAGSITNGIVSGIDRVIDADSSSTTAMKYIQTNAAINPGNSGGALVNIYGQVIGINTAKISATGYEGLGFAIPIATAKPVIDDLSSVGYVSGRVKIGITCTEVTSSMAMYYNVPTGLLIYTIQQDCELYGKAQVGDIIDKVDGKDISSLSEMQDIFAEKKVGDEVTLEIYRPAESRLHQATTFTVTIHLLEDKGDTETQQANEF